MQVYVSRRTSCIIIAGMKKILRLLRKRWWIVFLLVIVGGFFLIRSRAPKGPTYAFENPQYRDIEEGLEVSGAVNATKKATLRFLGGGKITYLPVHEGQQVHKGQVIASIDMRELKKSLQKELNDYMTSRLNFEQGKDDQKNQVFNDAVRRVADKSQLTLNNTVIDVELQDLALKNASLYAPFSGLMTKVPITSDGVQVAATDSFEVVDPASLIFEGEIDEVDLAKVQVGQDVRITLDAYPNEPLTGKVDEISLTARPSTSSSGGTVFPVKVHLNGADIFKYRLGLNGTMMIVRSRAQHALSIPISATRESDGKTFVLVRTQANKVEERSVVVGIENDEFVEVRSGLTPQDQIAVSQ
jgi:membrane fusion protein, multidrug efflux system